MRASIWCLSGLLLSACPPDASQKTQEKLKALEQAKAAHKQKELDAHKPPPAPPPVQLSAPWAEDAHTVLRSDGPCPEGFWALFAGDAPGANPAEKKANGAKRAELAKALREKTYLVKLRAPQEVTLKPFDAPKGQFPLEVVGTIDCNDSFGHVAIAWTAAKATQPANSAAKQDAELTQNVWQAPALTYSLPMKTMAEAKEFEGSKSIGLSARLVFKLGKTEIDRKLKKVEKVTEKAAGETLSFGGGTEDWGAGRLVRAELSGVRIATDREQTELYVERK